MSIELETSREIDDVSLDQERSRLADDRRSAARYLVTFSRLVCERISAASELISSSEDYPDEIMLGLIDEVEELAAAMIAQLGASPKRAAAVGPSGESL